jgi:AAHS family 4-hydroxybenzoate transporter-like MFS transporter
VFPHLQFTIAVTPIIDVARVIDESRVGALHIRVLALCATVLVVDGFDVQAITYVAPAISRDWGAARGAFGPTFASGLVGVALGAVLLAPVADRVGRRPVILLSCVAFGLCTLATVLVGSLRCLLVLRLFTGLGLGAALPNAIALAAEYAPKRRRAFLVMVVSSGISLGSIAAGLVAARLVDPFGWRAVFVVAGVLPLLLAGGLWRALPESIQFLATRPDGQAEAGRLLKRLARGAVAAADLRFQANPGKRLRATVGELFRHGWGSTTLLLWVAFFSSLLNVYLAVNWLPTSLHASGFTMAEAAGMTSMYHAGGVLGTYVLALLMDRAGLYGTVIAAFLVAVGGLLLFASVPGLGAGGTTAILMATGFGVIGGQVGLVTLASTVYPVGIRSTGLGWALGIGRIGSVVGPTIGGLVLAAHFDPRRLYLLCIMPALAGALAVAGLWRRPMPVLETSNA